MATQVLGSVAQAKRLTGPAQVYLAAYPEGGYTGATDEDRIKAVKALFFTDAASDACRVLKVSPYSDLDATGVECKVKQDSIEFDPNLGAKYKLANGPIEASFTWSFKDLDANKLIDMFSAVADDTFTTEAGPTIAGRKTVILGRNSQPLFVAVLLRYPSEKQSPGGVQEFRNVYLPFASITPDWTLKIDKKSAAVCKVTATAIGDMSLIGGGAYPPSILMDDVTDAATAS